MYNIDLYNYWKDPYSQSKKYSIHPLNEPGKEKYYSNQSHTAHYLKRTDPFVFKSILGVDYDTLVHQQAEYIAQLNTLKSQKIPNIPEEKKINENEYQKGTFPISLFFFIVLIAYEYFSPFDLKLVILSYPKISLNVLCFRYGLNIDELIDL